MIVTPDHWLDPVNRQLIEGGAVMAIRRFLVIHFTDGASAKSSIEWWRNPEARGANAHIVIERDGTIYQCRPFNRTCGHAGASSWKDPNTGVTYYGLNACSIGIELANGGCDDPGPDGFDWAKKQKGFKTIRAAHKNGGPVTEWEVFYPEQLRSCAIIAKLLVERYKLDDVVGHDDIAPKRKVDPGPAFPMGELRKLCGFPEKIG